MSQLPARLTQEQFEQLMQRAGNGARPRMMNIPNQAAAQAPQEQAWHGPVDFIVKAHQATGDAILLFTAATHIVRHFGNKFRVHVESNFPEFGENNPWLTRRVKLFNPIEIEAGQCWQWINERSDHLIQEWIRGICSEISKRLGTPIEEPRMKDFMTAVFLTDEEKSRPLSDIVPDLHNDEFFAGVDTGYKDDYSAKRPDPEILQEVINATNGQIRWIQIGRETTKDCADIHPRLTGVTDAIGKTENRRDLARLIHHASIILTPISLPMHLAAMPAKNGRLRQCIVIAGGRESTSMIQYPGHKVLSTIGRMDCCARGACLKVHVEPRPGNFKGCSTEQCLRPDRGIASCIRMISAKQIISAVESSMPIKEEPRICVATLAIGGGEWEELAKLTFPNKREYAARHGYGFVAETHAFKETDDKGNAKPSRPPAWSKLPLILRVMTEYTHILFIDGDAIITNPEIKVESLIDDQHDFWACEDQHGFNSGVMIVKSTEESWRFLRESYEKEHLKDSGVYEQAAMGEWLRANVGHFEKNTKGDEPPAHDRLRIKLLPQRAMNSYPCNWQPGDFIKHFPRDPRWQDRVKLIRKALDEMKENSKLQIPQTA